MVIYKDQVHPLVHSNGVLISHWQGTFTPANKSSNNNTNNTTTITFKGRDTNTNNRFIAT